MSTITARLVSRFDRWLDRLVATDDRYICAACDDRFHSRVDGIDHVRRCHPEYQGVLVFDDAVAAPHTQPARTPSPVPSGRSRSPLPVAVRIAH
ncbi:MAG: hypothetical protein QM779_04890 [Propionicimonas sp.]|uniref:hypothetical protein n=1 Tax=Propionicimonas sp. TaxID=1955623 RepID=UPI003D0A73EC